MKNIAFTIVLLLICLAASAQSIQQNLQSIIDDNNVSGIQLVYTNSSRTTAYNAGAAKEGAAKTVTSNTIFRAGSLGKSVFAYAIMRLYDRGVISLDTPLLHYIGSYNRFDKSEPRFSRITARMVLSHTSGLEFYGDSTAKLIGEPGKAFCYSSEGYFFLQKVIEKLTGMPLEDMMQQEVFKPLNMTASTYIKREGFDNEMLGEDNFDPNAAFTLYTNATDYNIFLQALINNTGLKPATAKLVFTQQSDAQWLGKDTTKADNFIDWGLGVGLQRNENGNAIWHWGSIMNTFNSFYMAFPDKKQSLVFFTNSVAGLRVANEVVNLLFGKQTTWAMPWLRLGYDHPETMMELHKNFRSQGFVNAGAVFTKLKKAGYQFSARDVEYFGNALLKQKKMKPALAIFNENAKLYPADAAVYKSLGRVYLASGNKPLALKSYKRSLILDTANMAVAYHIKALENKVNLTPAQLAAFEGKYKLNIMEGIFMDVKAKGNGLTIDVPGGNKDSVFLPVSAYEFLNDDTGFTLKFNKDGSGNVTSILIHTKNTVDVWERYKGK